MDECIESCLECYIACQNSVRHCLATDRIRYVPALRECMRATEMLLVVLRSGIKSVYELSNFCAKVCDSLVEFINEQDESDENLQLTADECFQCSVSCRSVLP